MIPNSETNFVNRGTYFLVSEFYTRGQKESQMSNTNLKDIGRPPLKRLNCKGRRGSHVRILCAKGTPLMERRVWPEVIIIIRTRRTRIRERGLVGRWRCDHTSVYICHFRQHILKYPEEFYSTLRNVTDIFYKLHQMIQIRYSQLRHEAGVWGVMTMGAK